MNKFTGLKIVSSVIIAVFIVTTFTQSGFSAPVGSNSFEDDAKEMLAMAASRRAEKIREEIRDKSHDGRIRTGDDTSIGFDGKGIGLRKIFLLKKQF